MERSTPVHASSSSLSAAATAATATTDTSAPASVSSLSLSKGEKQPSPSPSHSIPYPRCVKCGGWGRDLLAPSGKCAYCITVVGSTEGLDTAAVATRRSKNEKREGDGTFTRPEQRTTHSIAVKDQDIIPPLPPRPGYKDVTAFADGGVLKKVLKRGTGEYPQEGCPCLIQFVGRLMNGDIFDTTRDVVEGRHIGGTDDPMEFQIWRDKGIRGWDLAISTMGKGEISHFLLRSDYAFGAGGKPPKVRPHVSVQYEIELLSWKRALPKFPSKAEMAESKRKREEQARRDMELHPQPTVDEKVAKAYEAKEEGNELYRAKQYAQAQKKYDMGFVGIYVGKEEWEYCLQEEERDKINRIRGLLHLNRAMCKLKQEKWDDALWDCDQVSIHKMNVDVGEEN